MEISIENLGKRFNRDWIFRGINYTFKSGGAYAITGANGSGKSTLLQVLAGAVTGSQGDIVYRLQGKILPGEQWHASLSFLAPYLELVEEMTAIEFLQFHQSFKNLLRPLPEILQSVGLYGARNKQVRYYSSGMKQRLKMAQAFYSDTPGLFLDEPTTNLDSEGIALYNRLVDETCGNRIVIVSSNDETEYGFCNEIIRMGDYKEHVAP